MTSEERREYGRRWRSLNREKSYGYVVSWRGRNPERYRQQVRVSVALRRGYAPPDPNGPSDGELYSRQRGACAICGRCLRAGYDSDHCHSTGKVRGLLCRTCNLILGKAHDNPVILRRAAEYVEMGGDVEAPGESLRAPEDASREEATQEESVPIWEAV